MIMTFRLGIVLFTVFLLVSSSPAVEPNPVGRVIVDEGRGYRYSCLLADNLPGGGQYPECTPRSGLPNFLAKCEKGGEVRVAYLGGSITSQSGWRVQTQLLLQGLYPKIAFEEIYAAIGGTGADLGVFRLERDVLQHKPDLLFVEFASNGGARKHMEGIVRNTWSALPDCDICFVYTVAGAEAQKLLEAGKLNGNATVYEEVAEHYGIPSVHLGVEAARLAREGKLIWKASREQMQQVAGRELDLRVGVATGRDGKIPFSRDGVHPYLDTGHKLYTAAIARSLPKIKPEGNPGPHRLPAPLDAAYVQNVSFLEVDAAVMKGHWEKIVNPGRSFVGFSGHGCPDLDRFLPSVWRGTPGSTLSFSCTGRMLMLYNVLGNGSGMIEVSVDGKAERRTIFDRYGYVWRLAPAYFKLGTDLAKVHRVMITVLSDPVDKRGVLAKANLESKFDAKPESFRPTDLVIGGLCIEGGTIIAELSQQ